MVAMRHAVYGVASEKLVTERSQKALPDKWSGLGVTLKTAATLYWFTIRLDVATLVTDSTAKGCGGIQHISELSKHLHRSLF